ncbi:cytochrome P450 [Limnoglobus roseus]|uniref:Cytochrome P450 n=1 Tax=Limnoglobus roseus TaxID=2598579 RepID=A0A5C1AH46_9BACT|nr:cytochrome P450 [Limnoglobus roseus]QEL16434.1 cytochrome P450 [Limnoglobus roseus]
MPPNPALPPGPKGTFLLGNLRQFTDRRIGFFQDVAREYGDLASFRFGPRRLYLASHPDLIEQVLVTDARHYIKHFGARMYSPVLGNGLVTSEGDFWLRQRRLSQPAFLKSRVLSYAPVVADLTDRFLAGWKDGDHIDVHTAFSHLTSVIALKTFFGLDDVGDREAFVAALREAFTLLSSRFARIVRPPDWLPTRENRRVKAAIAQLDKVVAHIIALGKQRGGTGDDLLARLLAARDADGSAMTDRQLRDEAMTLYLAGHETTALTLAWSWYLLSQHPAAEEKLAAEWRTVLGGRTPTADDLGRLPYTDAVLAEVMRLYPPVYLIGREATKDLELGGYRVRRGTTVFMCQAVSHRDPRYFGPDPDVFRPERWLDGLAGRIPKYAYYPFGGGPRVCIGNGFAAMEAAVVLAAVGQRYRFTLDPDAVIDVEPQITLLPKHGIPATLRCRV